MSLEDSSTKREAYVISRSCGFWGPGSSGVETCCPGNGDSNSVGTNLCDSQSFRLNSDNLQSPKMRGYFPSVTEGSLLHSGLSGSDLQGVVGPHLSIYSERTDLNVEASNPQQ